MKIGVKSEHWRLRNVRDYVAGFDYTNISIDIYILADALILITFEWIAIPSVYRMIATHSSNRSEYISTEVVFDVVFRPGRCPGDGHVSRCPGDDTCPGAPAMTRAPVPRR